MNDLLPDDADAVPFGDPGATLAAPGDVMAPATPPDLLTRIGQRIIRRPSEWLHRPWPAERVVQFLTAAVVLTGCAIAVMQVVHLDLLFADNTPTGGDMGAHVLGPAELRDNLLPHFQLTGWSNAWYNGFPLYKFYMIPPALLIVLFDVVLPYGVAFKLVTVLGIFALPFCCWAFGRLARFRYPVPELMALAGVLFLFDESFSIYGGNVKSTMAGEFSFSIALSLGVLGLGMFTRGLETGKHRSKTAIVIALAMLSHGLIMLVWPFLLILMWLIWMDRTRFWYGVTTLGTAALLIMFWFLPFFANTHYMTDMKYGGRPSGINDSFWDMFFDWPPFLDFVVNVLALVGFVTSVVKRQLTGAFLGIACIALMAATYVAQDSIPGIGLLWNPRLLPFLYLLRFLLMMVGIVDLVHLVIRAVRLRDLDVRLEWVSGLATFLVVGMVVLVGQLFQFRVVPGGGLRPDGRYAWGIGDWYPITMNSTAGDAASDSWPAYNFRGYEGKWHWNEYRELLLTMKEIGADRGCGRALWENHEDNGSYGTTMALMLLPFWTDGCISSSEGLFFETSGTTPYHFLTAAAMSAQASDPVRQLRYTDRDASVGVPMMQKMGINYLMVFTEVARENAAARGELTLIAEVGPWDIYEVADSPLVQPLTVQPVVVNPHASEGDDREMFLEVGTSWFQNPEEWAALPAHEGPAEWQHIDIEVDQARSMGGGMEDHNRKVDVVVPVDPIEVEQLPEITVSNVVLGEQDLSFDVSEVGVPVLVKISYFPNWTVEGATGPYHVAPNFMVVIPTSTHVRLSYGAATVDYLAYLLTFIGIGLLVLWRVKGDVVHVGPHPFMAPLFGGRKDDEFTGGPGQAAPTGDGYGEGLEPDADAHWPDDGGPWPDDTPASGQGAVERPAAHDPFAPDADLPPIGGNLVAPAPDGGDGGAADEGESDHPGSV